MTQATHTPGPYAKSKCASHSATFTIYSEATGDNLAVTYPLRDDQEAEATACLFEAAPDMLDALRLAFDALSPARNEFDRKALRAVSDAIAKATP
jgi:hypothetical protein